MAARLTAKNRDARRILERRKGVNAPSVPLDGAPDAAEATTAELESAQPTNLRRLLIGLDLLAASLSWLAAAALQGGDLRPSTTAHLLAVPVVALTMVALANGRRLYRAQVCSIRAVEVQRLGQVVLMVCAAAWLAGPAVGLIVPAGQLVAGGLTTFALASIFRGGYRSWLARSRCQGRFQRQVVIVGANEEAHDLSKLVAEHPQLGLDVIGVIGNAEAVGQLSFETMGHLSFGMPYLGPLSRTEELVRRSGASGVLIAASALATEDLNRLTRNLLQAGIHVHLSTGLRGMAAHRLRPQLLAQESVLYLEPLRLARWQLGLKRLLDIVLGTVIAVLTLPLVVVAALAIKLEDGGPVIFRQARVGRNGRPFTMYKLRTMDTDAEARYDELVGRLSGRDGPLVKLRGDPRVTRVGRILRTTSIDELPQLLNVFNGSMSLVGPRPNLLVEAEGLDPAFLTHKCSVRPGISGLWQIEARDDPSFTTYRRLDIFYLENWSIGLDCAILLATVQRVLARSLRLLVGNRSARSLEPRFQPLD